MAPKQRSTATSGPAPAKATSTARGVSPASSTPVTAPTQPTNTPPAASTVKPSVASSSKPGALATTQTWDRIAHNLVSHYLDTTPQRTKLLDAFMAFLVAVGALQFVYCILAGNYVRSFNFLSHSPEMKS